MTTHSAGSKAMTDIGLVALWQLTGLMLFIIALVGLYFIILALGTKDVEIPGGPGLAAFCLCATLAGARLGHRARAPRFPLFAAGTAVTILIGDTAVNAFMMQDNGTPDPVTFGSILALYGLAALLFGVWSGVVAALLYDGDTGAWGPGDLLAAAQVPNALKNNQPAPPGENRRGETGQSFDLDRLHGRRSNQRFEYWKRLRAFG